MKTFKPLFVFSLFIALFTSCETDSLEEELGAVNAADLELADFDAADGMTTENTEDAASTMTSENSQRDGTDDDDDMPPPSSDYTDDDDDMPPPTSETQEPQFPSELPADPKEGSDQINTQTGN